MLKHANRNAGNLWTLPGPKNCDPCLPQAVCGLYQAPCGLYQEGPKLGILHNQVLSQGYPVAFARTY